jgi:hypothetical protein
MLDNKNTPAFPVSEETTDRIDAEVKIYSGLTKREYFAAMAMQGLMANNFQSSFELFAVRAVKMADAILTELSIPQP